MDKKEVAERYNEQSKGLQKSKIIERVISNIMCIPTILLVIFVIVLVSAVLWLCDNKNDYTVLSMLLTFCSLWVLATSILRAVLKNDQECYPIIFAASFVVLMISVMIVTYFHLFSDQILAYVSTACIILSVIIEGGSIIIGTRSDYKVKENNYDERIAESEEKLERTSNNS